MSKHSKTHLLPICILRPPIVPRSPLNFYPHNRRNVNTRANILSWRCNRLHGPIFPLSPVLHAQVGLAAFVRIKRAREVKRARGVLVDSKGIIGLKAEYWLPPRRGAQFIVNVDSRGMKPNVAMRNTGGSFLLRQSTLSRTDRIRFRWGRTPRPRGPYYIILDLHPLTPSY